MDDDSPWMDDEPSSSVDAVSEQEWTKLSQRYSDAGYRDGISSGKQARLQAGFDQGFNQTAPFARQVGSLRGVAASLLAILTTTAGAKHAGDVSDALGDTKAAVVAECRAVVSALGKLDEELVLPVDAEAAAHAKSHADEGLSLEMLEKKEMRAMEEAMNGLGGANGASVPTPTLDECEVRLVALLGTCGMQGVLPIRA